MRPPGQHQASWAAPDPGTEPALDAARAQSPMCRGGEGPRFAAQREAGSREWGACLAQQMGTTWGRQEGPSGPRLGTGFHLPRKGGSGTGLLNGICRGGPQAQRGSCRQPPQPAGPTLGWWPGVWGPLHKRGDSNLRLGFQDFSHPVPQCPTWAWEGTRREGAGTPRGPVLVTLALQTQQR